MNRLKDLRIFIETCRHGSMSACARKMDLSPAVVSASLKRLEEELDTLLIVRSTRNLRLTEPGERFLRACREAVELLDDARASLRSEEVEFSGMIRLSAPSDLGRNLIMPWLDEFLDQHPKVELRLQLSDALADLYSQPLDMALRYGEPKDSALIAIAIAPDNRPLLCASPAYLAQHGSPQKPDDLKDHNCLRHGHSETLHTRWEFHRSGQSKTVEVTGNRQCKDGDLTRKWAIAGKGIAFKSRLDVFRDLEAGRLVEIDVGWETPPFPLYLLCAERRLLSPLVNALKDHLTSKVRGLVSPP